MRTVIFEQYYLECLSHASYLIGDETSGKAVVVDPQRDVAQYVADAEAAGLTIIYVLETHFHADFLSGHLELAAATGAAIGYSSVAETEFESVGFDDGDLIELGEVTLEIRHTPGHTPESMSIVVREHPGDEVPYAVLTGDTLFIGDVGRPDLLSSIGFTRDELADQLFDSLHDKLMTLPDGTRVYPAHGAGSSCGKNLSTDLWSTIGEQRRTNYAVVAPDRATFIDLVTEGQPPAPGYFVYDAVLNRKDRELMDEVVPPPALDWAAVRAALDAGAVLVDGRDAEAFGFGHFRGAINVGLEGRYAEFAGSVLGPDDDLVLLVEPGLELSGKTRLGRIGYDRVIGYVADPERQMFDHPEEMEVASRLSAVAAAEALRSLDGVQLLDVRNPGEFADGAIPGALNIPVGQLPNRLHELDPHRPTIVYCAGGYRSSTAASALRRAGFDDVSDILGGFGAYRETVTTA